MSIDKMGNDLNTDKVFIVRRALIGTGWCCAPKSMTLEEVQKAVDDYCEPYLPAMNSEPETPWTVCPREHEDKALVSPGRCDEDCNRQHWFMLGGLSGVFLLAMTSEGRKGIPEDLVIRMAKEGDLN